MITSVDPHTYHLVGQPVPTHVDFEVAVDFKTKTLRVLEVVTFDKPGPVSLDSNGQVDIVIFGSGDTLLDFEFGPVDPIKGQAVKFCVPDDCVVSLAFLTSRTAGGLQWMIPEQLGGEHPLLYSQFESIKGRSVFILPDTPTVRFTYDMNLIVPPSLRGLVAANVFHAKAGECEMWRMTTPVPLYLVAINVGDFRRHYFSERCSVWATPQDMPQAIKALERTPQALQALEKLFGPYQWGAYSTIVLHQRGFPFGAMEHPCLTSMNGMLTTDPDEALRVTIHEATHSWFGNLITNSSWEHFWLNEGLTTFGEWLAIREVFGLEAMQLKIALSTVELERIVEQLVLTGKGDLTKLKTNLTGVDPDDVFSRVPYYKGALFLWKVMEVVGEERMMEFLRSYIATYRYVAIDTDEFLRFMALELGEAVLDEVDATTWVYGVGLPDNIPHVPCAILVEIDSLISLGEAPPAHVYDSWGNQEWKLYLSKLSGKTDPNLLVELDTAHQFSTTGNGMLQFEFLRAALLHRDLIDQYLPQTEDFLMKYGRTVYLKPLYQLLCDGGYGDTAVAIFVFARDGYHPISAEQVAKLLGATGIDVP